MHTNTTHYQRLTFWSEEDQEYVATIPGLPGISALAETPEQASAELELLLAAVLDECAQSGEPVPLPTSALCHAAPLLNLSALARAIGSSQSTLASKLARGTPLSAKQVQAVTTALQEAGLALIPGR